MTKNNQDLEHYIKPFIINGLHGRMLRMPAPKNKTKEILVVYGHHASLERMEGFARALNRYGAITIPDLPGFGGMDSYFKIGLTPTIDNLADYLAAFIKLRYRNRRITIVSVSLGFGIATRMLQKYPDLADRVDLLVSGVGFLHHSDIKYPPRKMKLFRALTKILSTRIVSGIMRLGLKIKPLVRWSLLFADRHNKSEPPEQKRLRIDFETNLWRINDIRTHFYTLNRILNIDICSSSVSTHLECIAVDNDQYLDRHIVQQHNKIVFSDFNTSVIKSERHAPTVVASADEAIEFIPGRIRKALNKQ
ncbi:MAG TPA: alpha/beta hydrolase [Candidatus Saccharibacteria bacterium]|nr:alpha/beta hydrolase [Candidatus Saccharibacteria bacterium]